MFNKGYKKFLTNIVILTVIIFTFTSCLNEQIELNEKEELNFRITWDSHSGRGETISRIIEKYNESSNLYHVSLIGGNEDANEILNELELNQIDVFMMPYRYIKDVSISEKLISLNSLYGDVEAYDESMIELGTIENELKGIPWIGHSMCLVFNTQLCKAADVNPYTWHSLNDLVKACEAIEEKTEASGIGLVGANHHDVTWMVNQFIYTFGGSLVSYNNQGEMEISIDSKESLKAIEFYKNDLGQYAQENWQDHSGVDVMELFSRQEIAFEIQGPWAITDIWKLAKPFDVGVISLGQLGMYSEVGPIMLSIANKSEHLDGAIDFISYLETDEALEMILNGEYEPKYDAYYPFRIPIKKDLADSDFYMKYPEFSVFSEGFKRPSISSPCPEWATIQGTIYPEILHKMMTNEISIEEGLKEVTR